MILVTAALFVGGYFLFSGGPATPDLSTSAATSPAELLFINLAGELDPIASNGAVLNDPRFAALVDIRTAVVPVTAGRPDPFAPIGKGAK